MIRIILKLGLSWRIGLSSRQEDARLTTQLKYEPKKETMQRKCTSLMHLKYVLQDSKHYPNINTLEIY